MTPRPRDRKKAHRLGMRAESVCAWWLRFKGYRILAVRLRTPGGEIDLVARKGGVLAVVEVKARGNVRAALESVTPHKRARLERAAAALLADRKITGRCDAARLTIRFDVMAVAPAAWPRHVKDAWRIGCA